jgi:energy-coupling factor transporter transmembrane protein EcfT
MNKITAIFLTFYFFVLILFLPPLTFSAILASASIPVNSFAALFITGFLLMFVPFWEVAMLAVPFWFFANYLCLKIAPQEFGRGEKYVGVVVTTTNLPLFKYVFIYASGTFLIIEYLKRKNQPFKLMTNFDRDRFREMVYDANCIGLYIIGHGTRHGLRISKEEMLYYCEFPDAPAKEFVVQLHCNHLRGKSLVEYLNAHADFPMENVRSVNDNQAYYLNKLHDELHIDVLDIFRDFIFSSFIIVWSKIKSIMNPH